MKEVNLKDLLPEIETLDKLDQEALMEYYLSVKLLSEKSWNLEFNNRDMFHGAIVMSQIFKTAKHEINIFAGDFNGDICGKTIYQESLKSAVRENNVKLKVVFENLPNDKSPGLNLLKSLSVNNPESISVRLLLDSFKRTFTETNDLNHFTLADSSIFRFEIDKKHYKAFCNFDDKKLVEKLKANFEILEYNSEPIKL